MMPNGQNLITRWKIAGLVLLVGLAIPALAGADIFMEISGVPGEVVTTAFANQIDATSVSFGYSAPIDPSTGKQTKVLVAPITITKALDKSSPKLMSLGGTGTKLTKVVIRHTSTSATSPVVMTMTLDDVAITDWQMVSVKGEPTFEQVTFQPSTVDVQYVQRTSTGAAVKDFSGSFSAK